VIRGAPRGRPAHPYYEQLCPDPTPPPGFFEDFRRRSMVVDAMLIADIVPAVGTT